MSSVKYHRITFIILIWMDTATIIVRRKRETSCEEEGNDRKKFRSSRDDFACKGLLRDVTVVECQSCSVKFSNRYRHSKKELLVQIYNFIFVL